MITRILCFSALIAILTGCQAVLLHGVKEAGMSMADKQRSFGESINDSTIYAEINHEFLETDVRPPRQ